MLFSALGSLSRLIGLMLVVNERIQQVYTCINYMVFNMLWLIDNTFGYHFLQLMLFPFCMQVITIFLLVISALKLQMLLCMHVSLCILVVRKFLGLNLFCDYLFNQFEFLATQIVCGPIWPIHWLQRCESYVGPEDWAFKGFWICFFQKSAGTNLLYWNVLF